MIQATLIKPDPIILKEGKHNCPACGRKMRANPRHMDKSLVESAYEAFDYLARNGRKIFKVAEIFVHADTADKGGHTKVNNFQRLHYWGFIRKVEKRGGYWEFTDKGRKFFNNSLWVPRTVWVFNNEVQWEDEKKVSVQTVLPRWQTDLSDYTLDYIRMPYKTRIGQKEMLPFNKS